MIQVFDPWNSFSIWQFNICRSLFRRLRNCFLLRSNTWKVICHCFMISFLSFFLLKSHSILQKEIRLNFLVFLSTDTWRGYSLLLGQSQNLMELEKCLSKNDLRSFEMSINWKWSRWTEELNILNAIYSISNDDDVRETIYLNSLIDFTLNSK